jgi:hypothetical protein
MILAVISPPAAKRADGDVHDDDDDGPASGRVIDGAKAPAVVNKQAMAKTRTERIMVINCTTAGFVDCIQLLPVLMARVV